MERRELHRDAGPFRQGLVARGAADRLDRIGVAAEIARGVLGRARAFAQHVEGIARQPSRSGACPLERRLDRLAQHEMIAHDAHRLAGRAAHRGQADALGETRHDAVRRLAGQDDARGDRKRPSRSRDEQRVGLRLVMSEVALAELVLDQAVGGSGVRHAQQRFGEHHEGKAFLGRKRILPQHLLDAADAAASRPYGANEPERGGIDPVFDGR